MLLVMLMICLVVAVTVATMYRAAYADELWPLGGWAGRDALPAGPQDVMTTAEFGDYVRCGLEDLSVMLAQAARRRPR